jgi:hypothetical protein
MGVLVFLEVPGATRILPRSILGKRDRFSGHPCRLAEGNFGGFSGWPNLTLVNAGGHGHHRMPE